jgi:hypothetical protein
MVHNLCVLNTIARPPQGEGPPAMVIQISFWFFVLDVFVHRGGEFLRPILYKELECQKYLMSKSNGLSLS